MEREEQKKLHDVMNAIALFSAKETGILKGDYSYKQIGVMGAYSTDMFNTAKKFKSGEVSEEETRHEIHTASERALIATLISEGYDFITSKVTTLIRAKSPMLASVVETVAVAIKEPVVEFVTDVATSVVNKVKGALKRLAKIFG